MNIVAIAGNLTRDPESRSTQGGKNVCLFSIAINEGKDKTEFVNCVAFEKTGELIIQYVKKGDRLSLSGRISTRKWKDQEGKDRYSTDVIVNQFDFPPKGSSTSSNQSIDQTNYNDEAPF